MPRLFASHCTPWSRQLAQDTIATQPGRHDGHASHSYASFQFFSFQEATAITTPPLFQLNRQASRRRHYAQPMAMPHYDSRH
jgi:hypothetical protein